MTKEAEAGAPEHLPFQHLAGTGTDPGQGENGACLQAGSRTVTNGKPGHLRYRTDAGKPGHALAGLPYASATASLTGVSPQGTAAYDGLTDLPPLVERAVSIARRAGFANSCRPEHGRLLCALAGAEKIGETGPAAAWGWPGWRPAPARMPAWAASNLAPNEPGSPRNSLRTCRRWR